MTTLSNICWPINQGDSILHAWHLGCKITRFPSRLPSFTSNPPQRCEAIECHGFCFWAFRIARFEVAVYFWIFDTWISCTKSGSSFAKLLPCSFWWLDFPCALWFGFCKKTQPVHMWWYVCILCRPNVFQASIYMNPIYLYIQVYVYYDISKWCIYVCAWHSAYTLIVVKQDLRLHHPFEGQVWWGIMQYSLFPLFSRQLAHSTGGCLKLVLWSPPPPLGKTIPIWLIFCLRLKPLRFKFFWFFPTSVFSYALRQSQASEHARTRSIYPFHYCCWWLRNPTNHLGWGMPFFVSRVIMRNHKT